MCFNIACFKMLKVLISFILQHLIYPLTTVNIYRPLLFYLQMKPRHWDHLKTLGTQMGHTIGVLSWVAVKTNDQTSFRFILLSWRCQVVLPN